MRYVFVCENVNCWSKGSAQLYKALEAQLEEAGLLEKEVELFTINCFLLCNYGPNIAILSNEEQGEDIFFHHVRMEDIPRIVAFLQGGPRPVDLEDGGVPEEDLKVARVRVRRALALELGEL